VFKERYEKAPPCRDQLTAVDFGLNADVKAKAGKPLLSFVPAGNVSVSFGNDTWASGSNECAFGAVGQLTDATVKVDGKVVVDQGTLKVAP
jgi:hypothetical protein